MNMPTLYAPSYAAPITPNERLVRAKATDRLWHAIQGTLCGIVIGFHAPKGTGKDTLANSLAVLSYSPDGVEVCAFADPLYEALSNLTLLPVEFLRDQANKNRPLTAEDTPLRTLHGKTIRVLMEKLGTEYTRDECGADHFVEIMKERITGKTASKNRLTLITDVRFTNEAALCDVVVELRREGDVGYGDETEHVSRRRLKESHIDGTYILTTGDFSTYRYTDFVFWLADTLEKALKEDTKGWRQRWTSAPDQLTPDQLTPDQITSTGTP